MLTRQKLRLPSKPEWTSYSTGQLCKLCDIVEWDDPEFVSIASDMMQCAPEALMKHRKVWEFTKVVQALKACNLLAPSTAALSVAAGNERILFYLARFLGRVIATDIYGQGSFADREADKNFLHNPVSFSPFEYPPERLKAVYMNAMNLRFPSDLFDVAICLSSIEHFGSFNNALISLREMGRVIRPGGIVLITTECALNGKSTDEVFTPNGLLKLVKQSGLALFEEMNWGLSDRTLGYLIDMRKDDLNTIPHMNLKLLCSIFTSAFLVLRKNGSITTHTSFERIDNIVKELASASIPTLVKNKPSLLKKLMKRLQIMWWKIQELTI